MGTRQNIELSAPKSRGLVSDDSGQATAEYAILALMTVTVVAVALEQVWQGILNHYQDLASLLCLPIP